MAHLSGGFPAIYSDPIRRVRHRCTIIDWRCLVRGAGKLICEAQPNSPSPNKYFQITDYQDNVRQVYNTYGVQRKTEYGPFGEVEAVWTAPRYSDSIYGGRFKYGEKELDDDLLDMYYFGARHYNPAIGRFSAPDPLKDYVNPYSYAHNNPVMIGDPSGMRGGYTFIPPHYCESAEEHEARQEYLREMRSLSFPGPSGDLVTMSGIYDSDGKQWDVSEKRNFARDVFLGRGSNWPSDSERKRRSDRDTKARIRRFLTQFRCGAIGPDGMPTGERCLSSHQVWTMVGIFSMANACGAMTDVEFWNALSILFFDRNEISLKGNLPTPGQCREPGRDGALFYIFMNWNLVDEALVVTMLHEAAHLLWWDTDNRGAAGWEAEMRYWDVFDPYGFKSGYQKSGVMWKDDAFDVYNDWSDWRTSHNNDPGAMRRWYLHKEDPGNNPL